jgi:hypothetical protein
MLFYDVAKRISKEYVGLFLPCYISQPLGGPFTFVNEIVLITSSRNLEKLRALCER